APRPLSLSLCAHSPEREREREREGDERAWAGTGECDARAGALPSARRPRPRHRPTAFGPRARLLVLRPPQHALPKARSHRRGPHLSSFSFQPVDIFVKQNKIFVEGLCTSLTDPHSSPHHWVHIWNVKDGRLVRLREYVDTSVNVMSSNDIGNGSHSNHHVVKDHEHPKEDEDQPILWSSSLGKHVPSNSMVGPSLLLHSP
ncbi:hypothetical protein GOP47_0029515, partial [Adiantum capillus-veneris]